MCRPNEGLVQLFVEHSALAAPGLDISSRAGDESTTEVQAMLERAVRDIRAVDLEALCIVAGRQVTQKQATPILPIISMLQDLNSMSCTAWLCGSPCW